MVRVPSPPVLRVGRALSIGILAALLMAIFLGVAAPTAAAAPTAPYFGPNVPVNQPPAYAGSTTSLEIGSDAVAYLAFTGWGGTTTQNDIFFSKSSDGRTWTVPIRVNNDTGPENQQDPALALDVDNNIVIAWMDTRNGNYDIFFSKSIDGGLSFPTDVLVNDVTTNDQTEVDLAVDPENPNLIHAVWTDTRSVVNGPDIFYANSTDGGLAFSTSRRINDGPSSVAQTQPAMAIAPNRDVYVVWTDPRDSATRGSDIYFSRSTNRGATWTANSRVNDDVALVDQQDPAIAVSGEGAIYVAWTDYRDANTSADIWATRSMNAGSL